MGSASTLLIRWSDGWIDVNPSAPISGRRREATLALGNVESITEAMNAGRRLLDVIGGVRETISVGIIPREEETTPYQGWTPRPNTFVSVPGWSDTSAQKVSAVTVTQDDDGEVTYELELVDRMADNEARIQRWLKRMSNGAIGGQSAQASPERPKSELLRPGRKPAATFSQASTDINGDLLDITVGYGPKLPSDIRGEIREWFVSLTVPGSSSTVTQLLLNDVVIATATIPAGEFTAKDPIRGVPVNPDFDMLQPRIVTAGTGAKGFTGQARAEGLAS